MRSERRQYPRRLVLSIADKDSDAALREMAKTLLGNGDTAVFQRQSIKVFDGQASR